eukprot:GEMP01001927.1.p1 GENE.GEMP01001927.1~~GEMP01001927.1.p1  ORF type:complete len:1233 (+),score=260.57 GEMP01001927.1:103-3801(+)
MRRITRASSVFNFNPPESAGLDLEDWRSWDGRDCGFFMAYYMNMPSYRTTAERNLTGEVLGQLYDTDCLLIGLLRLGVTSYSDQTEIANAIRLLARRIFTARCTIPPDIRKPKSRPIRLPTLSRTPFLPGQEQPKKKKPTSRLEAKMSHSLSLPTLNRNASVPSIPPFGCADATTPVDEARTLVKSISDRKLVASREEYLAMVKDVEFKRQAVLGKRRVDRLIESIFAEKKVADSIVCQLPRWLSDTFMDVEFAKMATVKFAQLDDDDSGMLEPKEFAPIIQSMTPGNVAEINEEQCYRMARIFDTDKNGSISLDEFVDYLKFVITVNYLETEGRYGQGLAKEGVADLLTTAVEEYDEFQRTRALVVTVEEFLALLEGTGDPTVEMIRSYAPEGLTFDADFEKDCLKIYSEFNLGELAVRGLRTPDKEKLRCILGYLSHIQPSFIRGRMVDRFEKVFKLLGRHDLSGGINEETFLKFCTFFMIMHHNIAADTRERVQMGILRVDDLLVNLESSVDQIFAMIPFLPADMRRSLTDANFTRNARLKFNELDLNQNGALSANELQPLLVGMISGLGYDNVKWPSVQESHCERFMKLFARGGKEGLSVDDFADFLRFTSIVSYLEMRSSQESTLRRRDRRESTMACLPTFDDFGAEYGVTDKKIIALFRRLKNTSNEKAPLWKELPKVFRRTVADEAAFIAVCGDAFSSLDAQGAGELESKKLLTALEILVNQHGWKISETQFTKVGEFFNSNIRGVIRKDEFPDFVKFCVVLEHLEAEATNKLSAANDALLAAFVKFIQEDFALFWDPSKAKQDSRDNFIPINTRLQKKWVEYFVGVEHVTHLHELYAFIDTDDNGYIDSNEIMPVLARMIKLEANQKTIPLGVPIIELFDADQDGSWSRTEFGAFLKFLFLLLIVESEARNVEIIEPKRLFEALFKPTWFSQGKDQLRLYPETLVRVQKEKRRLLDIWSSGMGEVEWQSIVKLQSFERMRVTRRIFLAKFRQLQRSSVRIQSKFRAHQFRKAMRAREAMAVVCIQARFRGIKARKLCAEKKAEMKTTGEESEHPPGISDSIPIAEAGVASETPEDNDGTVINEAAEASTPTVEAAPPPSVEEGVAGAPAPAAEEKEAAPTPEATEATPPTPAEEKYTTEVPADAAEATPAPIKEEEAPQAPTDAAEAAPAPVEEKDTSEAPAEAAEAAPAPVEEKEAAEAQADTAEVAPAPEEKEAAGAPADAE